MQKQLFWIKNIQKNVSKKIFHVRLMFGTEIAT